MSVATFLNNLSVTGDEFFEKCIHQFIKLKDEYNRNILYYIIVNKSWNKLSILEKSPHYERLVNDLSYNHLSYLMLALKYCVEPKHIFVMALLTKKENYLFLDFRGKNIIYYINNYPYDSKYIDQIVEYLPYHYKHQYKKYNSKL